MIPNLQNLLANKHTSGASIIFAVAWIVSEFGSIWFPEYGDQIEQTASKLRAGAIAYGLLMAGDGKKKEEPPGP